MKKGVNKFELLGVANLKDITSALAGYITILKVGSIISTQAVPILNPASSRRFSLVSLPGFKGQIFYFS